jgi:cysteinyl-tRNA synthetase
MPFSKCRKPVTATGRVEVIEATGSLPNACGGFCSLIFDSFAYSPAAKMGLKFFNTLSRSLQEFVPLDPASKSVGMYCCGPTVYDFAHIGNWRTFVFGDLVRRFLEFKGYSVQHVMNITDVEDKIIKCVHETKGSLREFTGKYETAFFEDLKTLNCSMPHLTPRATEHIPEIISLIEKLMARGLAYKAPDGSVYFSIEKYRGRGCRYGQLVKLNFDEMRAGERVKSDEYAKESAADFALWKSRVPEDGAVFWPSPWGEGRPGWHIECSAMSMKLLGPSFDLHLGGEDLIFPHHEDEIAQSEGAALQRDGERFVKYWLHGAHLLVEGKKMSKSLGNFFTLRDLLAKGFTGREIRYLLLTAHYRETFNFTLEGLQGARTALARIEECLTKLCQFWDKIVGVIPFQPDSAFVQQFQDALDDDLNVSKVWGVVHGWISELNRLLSRGKLSPDQAANAVGTWNELDKVFGLNLKVKTPLRMSKVTGVVPFGHLFDVAGEVEVPSEVKDLLRQRIHAREAKEYKLADFYRNQIKARGYVIEDTPNGAQLKRI